MHDQIRLTEEQDRGREGSALITDKEILVYWP